MYLVPGNDYIPPKKRRLEVLNKTQVIYSSDHKAAKIFVKNLF